MLTTQTWDSGDAITWPRYQGQAPYHGQTEQRGGLAVQKYVVTMCQKWITSVGSVVDSWRAIQTIQVGDEYGLYS